MSLVRRAGLAVFALGVIIIFGGAYVVDFLARVVSFGSVPGNPPFNGQSYSMVNLIAKEAGVVLVIAGAVLFYVARRKKRVTENQT